MHTAERVLGGRSWRRGAALLLAFGLAMAPALPASAHARPHPRAAGDPRSGPQMTLDKSVEGAPDPLEPGDAFSYKLTLSCSSLSTSCVNAVIEDTLPPEFDVTSLPPSTPTQVVSYDPKTRKLRIEFKQPLAAPPNPAGSVGLAAGSTADVHIGMRLPSSTPVKDGQSVTNTAVAKADNATQVIGTVTQTVHVPKHLDVHASKSWAPGGDVAQSGGVSKVTLGAANDSSGGNVSTIGIQDDSAGLWDHFDLQGIGPVERMPDGADRVTVLVCTKRVGSPCSGSEWVRGTAQPGPSLSLPAGVSAGQVTGIRFEFSNSTGAPLPHDHTGGTVPFTVKLRDTVRSTGAKLDPPTRETVRNCADPGVKDQDTGFVIVGEPACATHDILPNIAIVDVNKRFYPDNSGDFSQNGQAVQGERSGVTAAVQAVNSSPFPVATLTVTEPSGSAPSEFDKVDVTTLKADFPSGATRADLTVTCGDGTVLPVVTLTSPPASQTRPTGCPDGSPPKRVSITYRGTDASGKGTIAQGATAGLSVHGTLNDKVTAQDVKDGVSDCADAAATNPANGSGSAAATACATLPVEARREQGHGTKTSSQTEIPPGQPVDYTLGYQNTGNVPLPHLTLTDPPNPAAPGNIFDQLEITDVRVGTSPLTLPYTVELYDPTTARWVTYVPPDQALLGRAKGVRITAPDGVPVSGSIVAAVTVQLRPGVTSGKLTNCFSTAFAGRTQRGDTCSPAVDVAPARAGASLQKSLTPDTVVRPGTGVPAQNVTLRLTAVNTGNLSLKRLVLTDVDPGFFDGVTVTKLTGVTFPNGAGAAQVDVCTTGCRANPPVFVNGTPTSSTTPGFPAGVNAADIQGIRVTFSSLYDRYDITPATAAPNNGKCPRSSVCLVVQPRTTLRSDPTKPVPDTLADTASAAGESRLQNPGETFPVPDATADLKLVEGTSKLKVEKEPAQTVLSPGAAAPFNLHTTNTGTAPIPDLVVVDQVPDGLRFDDTFQGDGGRPYRITYKLPNGATAPADVRFEPVRDAGGRITKLVWRFPGWLMHPGTEVVISYQVKLQGGVAAGTVIPNVFGSGSETQPAQNCDPASPRLQVVKDDPRYGPGTFCTSSAQVTSRSGVSFDAAKWVTGDPALGYQDANTGEPIKPGDPRCPELVAGGKTYTRFPCIALTKPGQRFDYLIRIENAGTEPASSLNLLDVFPAPGDTGVLLGGDERGTQWDTVPRLTGPAVYDGPGDATLTYTATANPCGAVVSTPRRACNAASWGTDSTNATGLETTVGFPAGLQPGAAVTFTLPFEAPADLAQPGFPSIAWNSFAHSETVSVGGKPVALPVTEPPKAGIGLVFGNIRVLKDVIDPPVGIDVGPWQVAWSCLLTTASGRSEEVRTGQQEFTPGRPLDLTGVPAGAVCRIWETDAAGAQSDHLGEANAVVVTVEPQPNSTTFQRERIANRYPRRDLVIAKRVTGEAADAVGQGPFKVRVDCTFQGQQLPGFPQELVFRGNEEQAVTDLPQGAVCDVEETDDGGATHVEYDALSSARIDTVTPAGAAPVPAPGARGSATATVAITNVFATGSLRLEKKLAGAGQHLATEPFRFDLSCDFNGRTAVVVRRLELKPPQLTTRVDGLPVGAVCTVTETDAGGADAPAEPARNVVVKEGTTDLATAEQVNNFSVGRLALTKTLAGAAADAPFLKDAVFSLHTICRRPDGTTVLDRTVDVRAGQTVTLPDLLPIGAHCWAAELSGGVFEATVDHGDAAHAAVVTLAAPHVTITASNDYRPARLSLLKRVTGAGAGTVSGRTFWVELTCTLVTAPGAEPLTLVDHRRYGLRPGQVREVDDLGFPLPPGAHCWVAEPDHGGARTVTVDHGAPHDALVLSATEPGRITVTNDYPSEGGTLPPTGTDVADTALASFALLLLGTVARLLARTRRRA